MIKDFSQPYKKTGGYILSKDIQLLSVPAYLHPLTVKADFSGVTVLREGHYRKRYTGSKRWEVDINGVLRKKQELKKMIEATKKEPGKNTRLGKKLLNELPKGREKTYTVNKTEVRARLFSFIACQPPDKKELYFFTVTFPLQTEDEVIYRLFNTWLTKLRTSGALKNYLWVAERQKNGTLHFHLAIPHRLSVKIANREMMVCICTAIKKGEISYNLHAAKRYNGVDIAKNRKNRKVTNFALGKRGRRSLTGYLTKYVTKNDSTFTHLAWHNSRGFSELFTGVTFTFAESRETYHWRFFTHSRPAAANEYFLFFPWLNGPPPNLEGELLKLNSYIQNLN